VLLRVALTGLGRVPPGSVVTLAGGTVTSCRRGFRAG
jgi:hypothetical protein